VPQQIEFRIADCGFKTHKQSSILICNPKFEIRNRFCFITAGGIDLQPALRKCFKIKLSGG
jgi:hypothetical protein